MSLDASVTSPDLQKQISLLKHYPEIAEKHFRPAVENVTRILAGNIRPMVPVRYGKAQSALKAKVSGKGLNITGKVGFGSGKKAPWYINVVEYGAQPHALQKGSDNRSRQGAGKIARKMKNGELAGVPVWMSMGEWRTMSIHPGFPGRGFMKKGLEMSKPVIDAVLMAANEAIVKELVVP